jgi:hypothetical protein
MPLQGLFPTYAMGEIDMMTDVGEYIVGAYLKLEQHCDVVDYNVRPPGGGLEGLNELDVVGYDFANHRAYLCEVTTHIRGLLYGPTQQGTVDRIAKKHKKQREYAQERLKDFADVRFQFWSPYVPKGFLTENLSKISGLDLVINEKYSACVEKLRKLARTQKHDAGNPFFRTLQILEAMR